jgi:hypothetical protein
MKYRKLRIAWSVAWGILCLALIALWMRSYYWYDRASLDLRNDLWCGVTSLEGQIDAFMWPSASVNLYNLTHGWGIESVTARQFWESDMGMGSGSTTWGFSFKSIEGGAYVTFPHCIVVSLIGPLAIAPWIKWRFSLRVLLIGVTVVAIGLGLIAYALRG